MRRGARTPEELETLLEDAFVLRSGEATAELFEDIGVLVADDGIREAHGLDEIARLASQMWQYNCSYLAEPGRIVQAGNIALIMTMQGANVVLHPRHQSPHGVTVVKGQIQTHEMLKQPLAQSQECTLCSTLHKQPFVILQQPSGQSIPGIYEHQECQPR